MIIVSEVLKCTWSYCNAAFTSAFTRYNDIKNLRWRIVSSRFTIFPIPSPRVNISGVLLFKIAPYNAGPHTILTIYFIYDVCQHEWTTNYEDTFEFLNETGSWSTLQPPPGHQGSLSHFSVFGQWCSKYVNEKAFWKDTLHEQPPHDNSLSHLYVAARCAARAKHTMTMHRPSNDAPNLVLHYKAETPRAHQWPSVSLS